MNTHRSKPRKVGLWGHNGTGNLGNEATISAVIQNLRKREPGILLYGFSWNPQDTRDRHGIISFPINRRSSERSSNDPAASSENPSRAGWKAWLKRYPMVYKGLRWMLTPFLEFLFLMRSCRSIKDIDLMLVAGTGQLADSFHGAGGYPYGLFRWSVYCRIKGVKWAVVSAGAGPIKSLLSRQMIKCGLSNAVYRSFRDEYSRRLAENLGVNGANHVYPDLVFSLDHSDCRMTLDREKPGTVAFNALPYRKPGSWENPSLQFYGHYFDLLARFASWILARGYFVDLVATQVPMDIEFLEDLKSKISTNFPGKLRLRTPTTRKGSVEDVISQFSEACVVVTTRFHGVIFPYLLGKPVLAISVHPKISELMKDFGQERFCIDIESLDFDLMIRRFNELESSKDGVSRRIREKVELNKRLLEQQYLELLKL